MINRSREDFDMATYNYWITPLYKDLLFSYFTECEQKVIKSAKKVNGEVVETEYRTIDVPLLKTVMDDLVSESVSSDIYTFPLSRIRLYTIMVKILKETVVMYRY